MPPDFLAQYRLIIYKSAYQHQTKHFSTPHPHKTLRFNTVQAAYLG